MAGRVTPDTPITYLKGVGPTRAEAFRRVGVLTARDLLYLVPHRYEDASTVTPIASLDVGMDATIVGRVISKGVLPTRKGLRIFQAVIRDATGMIEAAWPGQPFLDRVIHKDSVLLLAGPVRFFHGRQMQPREYVDLGDAADNGFESGRVLAVYPATEGLTFRTIRSIVQNNLAPLIAAVSEPLPAELVRVAEVPPLPEALRMVHAPASIAEAESGRARLAYEELLFMQILRRRAHVIARNKRRGITFENRRQLTSRLRGGLPFELTGAQTRVIREIVADMTSPRRMHRLLQGDVGSGKTIVALFSAMLALENGLQAALMAPTELLAEQHQATASRLLAPLGVTPLLVTGRLNSRERAAASARMASDEPLLAIGTHALVQEATSFRKLGLAIIDEQHRFGVEQRAALSAKGEGPDVLLLSATPIPRSLALTMYGDLDVSTLDERPPGRQPVTTVLRPESARERVLGFLDAELRKGRQAYIVYPVIEESEKTDLKAATTMYERLSTGPLAAHKLALLHGRMSADQRDATMRSFREGEIAALVATTVVEVGIDVANATVMLVEHPERFGLSQLHQLRGRVGRGAEQSWCVLLGSYGQESRDRLELFASTDDGFEIAAADLRLRGMGDLFGQQQSGEAAFRIADIVRDERLLLPAREAAETLLKKDPELGDRAHAPLRKALSERFPRALELFRVG
ncbi:ATP-dependent DNA helicase RecG [soil metagenome]